VIFITDLFPFQFSNLTGPWKKTSIGSRKQENSTINMKMAKITTGHCGMVFSLSKTNFKIKQEEKNYDYG
jgi:hypothetical protein